MKKIKTFMAVVLLPILFCVSCKPQEVTTCFNSIFPYSDSKETANLNDDEKEMVKAQIRKVIWNIAEEKHSEASEDIEKAFHIVSDDFDLYFIGISVYAESDEPMKALESALQAIRVDPFSRDLVSITLQAMITSPLDTYSEVLTCLDFNVESNPFVPQTYFDRGLFYFALGYPEKALLDFKRSLDLDPTDVQVKYYASLSLMDLERYSEAIELMTEAISIESEIWEYYRLRGMLFEENDEILLAKADFESMLEYCSTEDSCYLASVYLLKINEKQ